MNTITRWHYHGSDKVYGDAVSNLGRIGGVVDACNQLVSTYLSNNTTQTKGIILSSTRRMLGFVSEIKRGLINTILQYPVIPPPHQDGYVNKFLHDLVVAFVAYDIIEEQLRSGNVYLISLS